MTRIDGKEYCVVPVHPNLIQMYGIARIKRSAKRMGVQLVEMTEEETQR
jgi:hypothetical protein